MNIIMSRAVQQSLFLAVQPQKQKRITNPSALYSPDSPTSPSPSPSPFPLPQTAPRSPASPTSPLDFTDKIPFRELELFNETLGSGSFGTVFKGRWQGRNVAVKQFKTRDEIDSFLVEVKQLSCVKHPNIVKLYGASALADTAYLIMEYAEGGSLHHLLHECKHQEYDLKHACSWAMQTARGVSYLHSIRPKPIMHRDLKPANLLLFSRGKILKICDFGTACAVKTKMTNNTGSASYMAPEVFSTSSYLESGDVFSWSIIFWEMLVRRQPYSKEYSTNQPNPYQILWSVSQGTRPPEIENCPQPIWNLIIRCWDSSPKKRPSMQQVAQEMSFIFSLTASTCSKETANRIAQPAASPVAIDVSPSSPGRSRPSLPSINSPFKRLSNTRMTTGDQLFEVIRKRNISSASTSTSSSSSSHHLYQNYPFGLQSDNSRAQTEKQALLHKVEQLQRLHKQLELECDKKNTAVSFEEFEGLKGRIKTMRQCIRKNSRQWTVDC